MAAPSPPSIANRERSAFTSGQLVAALISFTSIRGSARAHVSVERPRKREGEEEEEIRRKEEEIKEEADSPGRRSAPSDKVDQTGGVPIWMHARTHTHTHYLCHNMTTTVEYPAERHSILLQMITAARLGGQWGGCWGGCWGGVGGVWSPIHPLSLARRCRGEAAKLGTGKHLFLTGRYGLRRH